MSNVTPVVSDDPIAFLGSRPPTLLGCVQHEAVKAFWCRTGSGEIIRLLVHPAPPTRCVIQLLDECALALASSALGWQSVEALDRRTRLMALLLMPLCCVAPTSLRCSVTIP